MPTTSISVVIPARNEEHNLAHCLQCIIEQDYPHDLLEILIVDDDSSDKTADIADHLAKETACVQYMRAQGEGKKAALATGISLAKGDVIVTTDADCQMGTRWLRHLVQHYEEGTAKMVVGPVAFVPSGPFEWFQSLELFSLVGSTAGSIGMNTPTMSNGANLLFQREAFINVDGYTGISEVASGDDVLLLHKFHKAYPKQVRFCKSRDAIVRTRACTSVLELVSQRMRWVSKSGSYTDAFTIGAALIVFLFNVSLLICFALSWCVHGLVEIVLGMFLLKCTIDFLLLSLTASFFERKRLLLLLLPEQFLYILYVSSITIAGVVGNVGWKGRRS